MEEGSEGDETKKLPGPPTKIKRKMKTAFQLEILEKTYAVETYPSEALREELSAKLGLSDRQLQMWFCHRRLKDRKPPSVKRQRKESATPSPKVKVKVGPAIPYMGTSELAIDHSSGHVVPATSAPMSAPLSAVRIVTDIPIAKKYYESITSLEAQTVTFVEAQLGEPLRADGPILGMEFDSLPPDAFDAPTVPVGQQKQVGRPYQLYELSDTKSVMGISRALHEYQFLPEQPTVGSESYEKVTPSHYYDSTADVAKSSSLSIGHTLVHGSESAGYGLQYQTPGILPQQNRHDHPINVDGYYNSNPIKAVENPFVLSDQRVSYEDDASRMDRKRKVLSYNIKALFQDLITEKYFSHF